jgi:hypothetical protein
VERESLGSKVGELKVVVGNLEKTRKGLEAAVATMERIGIHIEERAKNLAKRSDEVQLEIEKLEKLKEENNV